MYGFSTLVLVIVAIYVGITFPKMAVDISSILDAPANSVFKGDMAMIIFVILSVLVLERYANRSDTKPILNSGLGDSKES